MAESGGMIKRGGVVGVFRFILRHWYVVWLFIFITPLIISSIQFAVKTNNLSYPFVQLGLTIINSDMFLYNFVDNLSADYYSIVKMQKPTDVFSKFKYYFLLIKNVWWVIFTHIWLIFLPFFIIYNIIKHRDLSKTAVNFIISILIFTIYLFIINLIIVIQGITHGNTLIIIPEGLDLFQELWFIIKNSMPFKGLYHLGFYVIGFFV